MKSIKQSQTRIILPGSDNVIVVSSSAGWFRLVNQRSTISVLFEVGLNLNESFPIFEQFKDQFTDSYMFSGINSEKSLVHIYKKDHAIDDKSLTTTGFTTKRIISGPNAIHVIQ